MNRLVRRITCMSLLLAGSAAAQDFLPPADRAHAAIAAHAQVEAAQARVDEARENAHALAASPHDISLSIAPLRRTVRDAPTADGRARYGEWNAQLTRAIRLPGKAALDREAGAHGLAAAELLQGDAEHQTALTLLDDWIGWLRANAAARVAQARRQSLQREQAALARRVELGDAAQRELEQIAAESAVAEAQARQAQAELDASRLRLTADFAQIPLPERTPLLPEPQALDVAPQVWIDRIIERSHEIRAAEELAAQQQVLAQRANADRLPDPSIGIQTFSERGGMERGIGLVFEIPFGGARRSAQARAASASADALTAQARGMRREVARDARLRVAQVQSTLAVWQAAQQAREANARSFARQKRAYELGEIDLAQRLQAERLDAGATLDELRKRADAHEAYLRMLIDSHELWHERDDTEGYAQH